MRISHTRAAVVAGAAVFFVLGGSALAVSHSPKKNVRCANGTVRGVAAVVGETNKGMANVPDQFASTEALFSRTFNCSGGPTQVRRVAVGVYEVRFPGSGAATALVSAPGTLASVESVADGFRVTVYFAGSPDRQDAPFEVVAV